MKTANAIQILTQREPAGLYEVVEPARKDAKLRDLLVEGSFAKDETYRYNCVRVLFRTIAQNPILFYQYWDRFEKMIDSPNGFHRSAAAQAIAHLSGVDTEHRLDPIFDHYLGLLNDTKVMVTHYFLETLGVIYEARPDLRHRIIATLLNIDKTDHPQQRKDLLKADVISIFDRLFDGLSPQEQKRAKAFAEGQLDCTSSKTRKAAREFQRRYK